MKQTKSIIKTNDFKNNGITLIALVITIIVLLILAGVSIAMLTGDNGILTQAQNAKEKTEQAKTNESSILGSYVDIINAATVVTGGEWSEEKLVNTPALNKNIDMKLVRYQDGEWVEDTTGSNYNYIAGTGEEDNNKSEWANARVTIDGIESYFVWIPRYAYKINYNEPGNISAGGTIDVKFLKGTSNIAADGTVCKYADDSSLNKETDYIIHPAFTSNVNLGGWRNELTGIWVGKYESSLVNKADKSNIVTQNETAGNILLSENTDKAMVVQPGMSSWRYCSIGNSYTNARAYSEDLNSHMLKNSEWGAVAYLTYSKYGRNGTEITKNGNGSYITANGNIEENVNQSSTGNVMGIYDLSGGVTEYVASYYNGSDLLTNGTSFARKNGNSNEFITAYSDTTESTGYKQGDATYETSGWDDNNNLFVTSTWPFFMRGGFREYNNTGVFYYDHTSGPYNADGYGFRICLTIK